MTLICNVEAVIFDQGYDGLESQAIGEQDLIKIYTSQNFLAIVKYTYDAKYITSIHIRLLLVSVDNFIIIILYYFWNRS